MKMIKVLWAVLQAAAAPADNPTDVSYLTQDFKFSPLLKVWSGPIFGVLFVCSFVCHRPSVHRLVGPSVGRFLGFSVSRFLGG